MSGINTEHKVYIKVLTPVHVGGAQEKHLQEDIDTLFFKGALWKLNWQKVYKDFSVDEVANALIKRNGLYDLLQDDIKDYATFFSDGYGDTGETKSIIRDGFGKSFIPGSSIKGAMKNWLYSAYDPNSRGTVNLFGTFETDLFRFIKPYDCYLTAVEVFPVKIFNLFQQNNDWKGGWKHSRKGSNSFSFDTKGFVTDFECFLPGETSEFKLMVSKEMSHSFRAKLYDHEINVLQAKLNNERIPQRIQKIQDQIKVIKNGSSTQERFYNSIPIKELMTNINNEVKKHLEKEYAFFKKYKSEYSEKILEGIDMLLEEESNNSGSCLLRLSAGSGFHSMTGDFKFSDHDKTGFGEYGKKNYKSRKIAFTPGLEHFYLMGFVLLSTQPFEEKRSIELDSETSVQEKIISSSVQSAPKQTDVKAQYTNAIGLKAGDIVFAEIVALGKPFHKVKLMLENYAFEGIADLSGIKGHQLNIGQSIKCKLQQPSKSGEFKTASFISE